MKKALKELDGVREREGRVETVLFAKVKKT